MAFAGNQILFGLSDVFFQLKLVVIVLFIKVLFHFNSQLLHFKYFDIQNFPEKSWQNDWNAVNSNRSNALFWRLYLLIRKFRKHCFCLILLFGFCQSSYNKYIVRFSKSNSWGINIDISKGYNWLFECRQSHIESRQSYIIPTISTLPQSILFKRMK